MTMQLLCDQPEQQGTYLWDHPKARAYTAAVCMTGDAAHVPTRFRASSAGMSVEDSFVLAALLGHAKSPRGALAALQAYDGVRRPRTQRIVDSSPETVAGDGHHLCGRGDRVVFDLKKTKLMSRWAFTLGMDMAKPRDKAMESCSSENPQCELQLLTSAALALLSQDSCA